MAAEELTPEQWEKAVDIFTAALELPAGKRDSFLAEACHGRASLLLMVKRLVREDSGTLPLDDPILAHGEEKAPESVFVPGQVLAGRFHIVACLGAGGMGEVYEALDTHLRESIAVKTLRGCYLSDAGMVERFRAEVQRSRRVVHRNVCRVHDLFNHGREDGAPIPFFTMQLLRGQTLAERLRQEGGFSEADSLLLLGQIAEALHSSHEEGIIHRDLKPGNIFLVSGGERLRAVVTDFGLATQSRSIVEIASVEETGPGTHFAAGTPAYMAPEQMDGRPLTPQADIYALGLVAAEMRTGIPVYTAKSPLLCAAQKLSAEDPLSARHLELLSPRWVESIRRAIRREPEERFSTALEFAAALQPARRTLTRRSVMAAGGVGVAAAAGLYRLATHGMVREVAIAVLPFENAARDAALDYFSDGVSEEIIQSLTSYGGIRVVARNSAFRYRASTAPLGRIASELGATVVVTGSVRRTGDRVRVAVQLIDARREQTLWSEIYDRDLRQILAIQADIHKHLALQLGLKEPAEAPRSQPTAVVEAYDHYLKGRQHWNSRTKEGMTRALEEFHAAVVLDSSYAAAYAGIADSHTILIDYGLSPTLAALPLAKAALDRAIAIDPNLAEAHAAAGLTNCIAQWDQPAAERSFLRALALKPSLLTAHHWYGGYLMRAGRFDEALQQAEEARRLDPLSLPTLVFLGWVHHYRREYGKAIAVADEAIRLDAAFPHGYQLKALAAAASGNRTMALAASERAVRGISDEAVAIRFRGLALSVLPGMEKEAREAAERLALLSKERQAAYIAIMYAGLRDRERMFAWIDRAIAIRDSALLFIHIDRATDPYRNLPRFQDVLRQMGYGGRT